MRVYYCCYVLAQTLGRARKKDSTKKYKHAKPFFSIERQFVEDLMVQQNPDNHLVLQIILK